MENVSVKFQEDILKKIDESIDLHNYNSRTEFIREAVRDKLAELSKNEMMAEFIKFSGKSKIKTTDKENTKTKIKAGKVLMKDLEKKFT
jgi:metal-responsive CopG/Arc/MetJ family transcriptional regulator